MRCVGALLVQFKGHKYVGCEFLDFYLVHLSLWAAAWSTRTSCVICPIWLRHFRLVEDAVFVQFDKLRLGLVVVRLLPLFVSLEFL